MFRFIAAVMVLSTLAVASETEVVIAHYSEDLSWLSRIPKDVIVRIYTKGSQVENKVPHPKASLQHLPNVGRESHTYLHHIVENYNHLAKWTVFTQAGEPTFGYRGHRSGGGHLLAGDDFANYLAPHPSGSRFVYTSVVHLPSMDHVLRAAYCIDDELLEGGAVDVCPNEPSQWTPWWDVGEFRKFVSSKIETQHGEQIMDFYRKYINPEHTGAELTAFFPQGARFAISREMIQRRPKADYEQLLAILSNDEDSYAGYLMEWLWSELFLGHSQPCAVPAKLAPVSHEDAMRSLSLRFPDSMERLSTRARSLATLGASAAVSSPGCKCAGVSGGVSGQASGGGISGGVSGGVSGGISAGITGGVSGGVSGDASGHFFGAVSGSGCACGGVSGGIVTTSLSTIDSASTTTTTTIVAKETFKVAGTLEVEIVFEAAVVHSVMVDIFKKAIANVLEVPVVNVAKVIVLEIETRPGLRRLQSTQTKHYDVAYEVIVPSSMDADALVGKMNGIAVPGSSESQGFRQVLTSADAIAQVGLIVAKIVARKYEHNATTPLCCKPEALEEEDSWTSLVVGSIAVFMALLCGTTTALLLKRKLQAFPTQVQGQKMDADGVHVEICEI